jgi:hypothetical protein
VSTAVKWWFSGFWNGNNLSGFPGNGELSQHLDMVKKLSEVDESLAREIFNTVTLIPSGN